ncbi:putative MFS monocarboxylate transporter [Hyaloscypha variabilis F]|uniref:Putative MFS monocarboxylate transporter n=1 Tax=Hyaloscypha variabilis (strain UAMH 11265 / GT02V1 / F) TaxID=1149755 RepID=A0A2J6QZH8_HYAVF|nr:putative MFS monocarboxylate transporter [Hyaloscypha variabilis F]
METVPSDLVEDKITSDSNSSVEDQEKAQEVQPVGEGQVENEKSEKSESVTALLQVVGAFFLMFNSWGIANTFGAYQIFYEANLLKTQTPSQISWIGSIQAFLLLAVGGFITGPIFDAGYLRGLVLFGSAAAVFGMMMTSICKEYWQVILAQGVVTGIGVGCMMLPSVAVMPQYFKTRRAFATGVAASGSSLGGIIYPTIFHELEPKIGFGWTTRVIAFIMLATLMVPIAVMKAKVFPAQRRPLFDFKVLHKVQFDLFCVGTFFGFMGMYIPFYYVSSFGISHHVVDANLGFYLLTILNAASIFGRIIPNFFADKTGALNIMTPWLFFCGIIGYSWISATSAAQIILVCIFYGFFSGTLVSIIAPAVIVISPDLSLVGTHMGMNFGFTSLGLLIGNPVAGVLLEKHGYLGPAMWCGTCNVLAGIFILASRLSKTGPVLMVKA